MKITHCNNIKICKICSTWFLLFFPNLHSHQSRLQTLRYLREYQRWWTRNTIISKIKWTFSKPLFSLREPGNIQPDIRILKLHNNRANEGFFVSKWNTTNISKSAVLAEESALVFVWKIKWRLYFCMNE